MQPKRLMAAGVGMVVLAGIISFAAAWVAVQWHDDSIHSRSPNTSTVVVGVQALSQLVTVKYVLEKVVIFEDPKYLGGIVPLGQNRIILLAHGEVKAGVDLSRVRASDVTISNRKIVLTIPRATVTDAHLVEQKTRVLDYKSGMFVPFDKNLEQTARRTALSEISHAARQGGIEDDATQKAQQQLTHFLQSLGFEEAEVRLH